MAGLRGLARRPVVSDGVPMAFASTDVHLWYRLTESLDDQALRASLSLLSDDERGRHERFVFPEDRRDYSAAHALVRRVVGAHEGIAPAALTFETRDRGKPALASRSAGDASLQFNLSHTRGLVACALVRGADVGVDVERIDRATDNRQIADRYFSPSERADLDACDAGERSRRFIDLWTLKEAYLKATGVGLSEELDTFSFRFPDARRIAFAGLPDEGFWTFALFAPTPLTRMAVAVRASTPVSWRIVARDEAAGDAALVMLRQSQPAADR